MMQTNINTSIFRSLISFGIIIGHFSIIGILSVSAHSSKNDAEIERVTQYNRFYVNSNISMEDALIRVEEMCFKQNASECSQDQRLSIITVINSGKKNIDKVYVSKEDSQSQGLNILGKWSLLKGDAKSIIFSRPSTQCNYEAKAVYSDGTYASWKFNLCETSELYLRTQYGD